MSQRASHTPIELWLNHPKLPPLPQTHLLGFPLLPVMDVTDIINGKTDDEDKQHFIPFQPWVWPSRSSHTTDLTHSGPHSNSHTPVFIRTYITFNGTGLRNVNIGMHQNFGRKIYINRKYMPPKSAQVSLVRSNHDHGTELKSFRLDIQNIFPVRYLRSAKSS